MKSLPPIGIILNLLLAAWIFTDPSLIAEIIVAVLAVLSIIAYVGIWRDMSSSKPSKQLQAEMIGEKLKGIYYSPNVLTASKISSVVVLASLAYSHLWVVFTLDVVASMISYSVIHHLIDEE